MIVRRRTGCGRTRDRLAVLVGGWVSDGWVGIFPGGVVLSFDPSTGKFSETSRYSHRVSESPPTQATYRCSDKRLEVAGPSVALRAYSSMKLTFIGMYIAVGVVSPH